MYNTGARMRSSISEMKIIILFLLLCVVVIYTGVIYFAKLKRLLSSN